MKFFKLTAAVVLGGLSGARHGADAYGPGLIDSLVREHAEHARVLRVLAAPRPPFKPLRACGSTAR